MELAQKYTEYVTLWKRLGDIDLQNDLGFSLYTMLFICCVVVTSEKQMKSKMEVSTNWVCCH